MTGSQIVRMLFIFYLSVVVGIIIYRSVVKMNKFKAASSNVALLFNSYHRDLRSSGKYYPFGNLKLFRTINLS